MNITMKAGVLRSLNKTGIGFALLALLVSGCASHQIASVTQPTESAVISESTVNPNAPYPQSHASTIAETSGGELVAAWFGGLHERHPQVGIWVSRFENGSWQKAQEVATGEQPDGSQLPTWNPVLFQPPQGDLRLFYKVGPNPREWWGMVKTSADGGRTWSEPRRLPDGIFGPIKNKPIVTAMGNWLAPSSSEHDGWYLHFEESRDQGESWTRTDRVDPGPSGFDAIQPTLLTHPDGRLQALARTQQGVIGSSWSKDRGRTWTPIAAIDLPNPNAGFDGVSLEDGRQMLVYNHSAHHPANRPGKGLRYPLNVALSRDGLHWTPVLTLESEPRPEGYAYPAVVQTEDGLVHLTYTWNRETIKHVVLDPSRIKIKEIN